MLPRRTGRRRPAAAVVVAALLATAGCGADDDPAPQPGAAPASSDPGPVHVHGLGVNPADGALFIAAHTGLFRRAEGSGTARRVAGRWQDTMAFTIVGPNRFLASGHPDGREKLPPFLGLVSSDDAGKTWTPRSLLGEQDFHVLEARGRTVYGYGDNWETRAGALLVSSDGARRWSTRRRAPQIHDLAIDPRTPDAALAAAPRGLFVTTDAGRTWRRRRSRSGLIEWPAARALYVADRAGRVWLSRDGGAQLERRGEIGGPPHAFLATAKTLYAALEGGTIKRSDDEGQTWTVAYAP